ncbi:MAG: Uma2 family endonuclease [Cyanobacteria bacterium]|nr:Uma2 family endonuclease [Cyanobacteriota bacterium]MDA0866447.1 Uma2 family endonuclease [Cyanobacteriota bacterium]
MVQAVGSALSFEQFLDQYPNNGGRYELIEGEVVEVRPTGAHEDIGGFIALKLGILIDQGNLPLTIPRTCVVKPGRPNAGYIPDVAVLDRRQLVAEPLWEKASTVCHGRTATLVIEVVSTNWRDDYGLKLADYEAMGIAEYWIVDFRALGAARVIGQPKQPTLTICTLGEDGYQLQRFTGQQQLLSAAFPALKLTAQQVFEAGQSS